MNPQLRIGLIIALIGIVLVGAGIFVALQLSNTNFFQPAPQPTQAPQTTLSIAVAANDLAAGSLMEETDITFISIPVQFAPRNTISDVAGASGKILKVDLVQGEMVLEHHLANPTDVIFDIPYILDDTHVLMALPANDLMSQEAIIKRGDIIDVLVSYQTVIQRVGDNGEEEEEKSQTVTFDALQRMSVTALVVEIIRDERPSAQNAQIADTEPTREQMAVQTYLVALDPQDALILKYFKDVGAIFDYVLRAPTSSGQFDLTPVTNEFIKELYGLELLP